MRSRAGPLLLILAYLAGLNLFFVPTQRRLLNRLGVVDVLLMLGLVLPFLATRWLSPPKLRATRVAWYLTAAMAVDILSFAILVFAPTGGHPSGEALVLHATGFLKVLLAPAAVAALVLALAHGERIPIVVLGLVAVVSESVFLLADANHPFRWLLLRTWTGAIF